MVTNVGLFTIKFLSSPISINFHVFWSPGFHIDLVAFNPESSTVFALNLRGQLRCTKLVPNSTIGSDSMTVIREKDCLSLSYFSNLKMVAILDRQGLWSVDDVRRRCTLLVKVRTYINIYYSNYKCLFQFNASIPDLPTLYGMVGNSANRSLIFCENNVLNQIFLDINVKEVISFEKKTKQRNNVMSYCESESHKIVVFTSNYCLKVSEMSDSRCSIVAFLCPYCLKLFSHSTTLTRDHMECHIGPEICKICKVKQ